MGSGPRPQPERRLQPERRFEKQRRFAPIGPEGQDKLAAARVTLVLIMLTY